MKDLNALYLLMLRLWCFLDWFYCPFVVGLYDLSFYMDDCKMIMFWSCSQL
jgi:hypothetical protein